MRIGLFIKNEVKDSNFERDLINKISSYGHAVDNDNPEVVLTIGGDGTFLKAVQKYLDRIDEVKFLCVNKGRLGYFSDFRIDELEEALSKLGNNELINNSYRLVSANINGEDIFAVNEIRIENPFHTLTCEVFVDDVLLETFRGNGLVVSTSLGSSGYNRSLGGAIVDLKMESLQLSEVAPLNNCLYSSLKSSLVLSSDSKVTFKGEFNGVVVGYDHLTKSNPVLKEFAIYLSDKKLTILNRKDRKYAKKLNESFIERR